MSVTSRTDGELPELSMDGNVDIARLFETTKRSSNVGVFRFSAMVKVSNGDVAVSARSVRKREYGRWYACRIEGRWLRVFVFSFFSPTTHLVYTLYIGLCFCLQPDTVLHLPVVIFASFRMADK